MRMCDVFACMTYVRVLAGMDAVRVGIPFYYHRSPEIAASISHNARANTEPRPTAFCKFPRKIKHRPCQMID